MPFSRNSAGFCTLRAEPPFPFSSAFTDTSGSAAFFSNVSEYLSQPIPFSRFTVNEGRFRLGLIPFFGFFHPGMSFQGFSQHPHGCTKLPGGLLNGVLGDARSEPMLFFFEDSPFRPLFPNFLPPVRPVRIPRVYPFFMRDSLTTYGTTFHRYSPFQTVVSPACEALASSDSSHRKLFPVNLLDGFSAGVVFPDRTYRSLLSDTSLPPSFRERKAFLQCIT